MDARATFALRTGKWLFFAVFLSLVPLIASLLGLISEGEDVPLLDRVLGQGELLLVAAAVIGAALAELLSPQDARRLGSRLLCGGLGSALLITASVWFATLQTSLRDGHKLDAHAVATGSLWIFGAAMINGLSCLAVGWGLDEAARPLGDPDPGSSSA